MIVTLAAVALLILFRLSYYMGCWCCLGYGHCSHISHRSYCKGALLVLVSAIIIMFEAVWSTVTRQLLVYIE